MWQASDWAFTSIPFHLPPPAPPPREKAQSFCLIVATDGQVCFSFLDVSTEYLCQKAVDTTGPAENSKDALPAKSSVEQTLQRKMP